MVFLLQDMIKRDKGTVCVNPFEKQWSKMRTISNRKGTREWFCCVCLGKAHRDSTQS